MCNITSSMIKIRHCTSIPPKNKNKEAQNAPKGPQTLDSRLS